MNHAEYPEQDVADGLRGAPIRPLDLTGRERQLRSALSAMERIGQRFVRYARRSMPFLVRQHARLTAGAAQISELSLSEAEEGPVFSIPVGPSAAQAWGSIRMNNAAIALTIEGSLGGASSAGMVVPNSEPTPAQKSLLARVGKSLAADFCTALEEEVGLAWRPILAEGVSGPTSHTLEVACPIEGVSFPARILVLASAEALEAAAREHSVDGTPGQTDPRLIDSMQRVPLEIAAELGRVQMGLRRLLGLRVGDVIRLRTAVDDAVIVRVAGLEKFLGAPVLSRGQLAIEIRTRHQRTS